MIIVIVKEIRENIVFNLKMRIKTFSYLSIAADITVLTYGLKEGPIRSIRRPTMSRPF